MESCIFCRIVKGEIRGHVVFEDGATLAFLDHRPLFPGHCLLAPKIHYETLLDLPTALFTPMMTNAQLLARAIERGLEAQGSFVAINNRISQSVPHLHMHVVPRRRKDGLKGFFWPRRPYKDESAILAVQQALRGAILQVQTEPAP
jgi:histidine triad (HIT) family protein